MKPIRGFDIQKVGFCQINAPSYRKNCTNHKKNYVETGVLFGGM